MKKKLQIFITVAMLSLFLIPVRVNAEPRASGNGYHTGTITYNGKNYSFTNSMGDLVMNYLMPVIHKLR